MIGYILAWVVVNVLVAEAVTRFAYEMSYGEAIRHYYIGDSACALWAKNAPLALHAMVAGAYVWVAFTAIPQIVITITFCAIKEAVNR